MCLFFFCVPVAANDNYLKECAIVLAVEGHGRVICPILQRYSGFSVNIKKDVIVMRLVICFSLILSTAFTCISKWC